ncbi:exocyst complex component EXO70A1-like [Trifolium pratense]|uniref:exocyst complex component EXO70A1-like n=1 Tax=Trifolium pratense TaxID=57577 RepID=UPI001E696FA4|nr:exocyst complex component EXO70A1-like [Trifolium pratense]
MMNTLIQIWRWVMQPKVWRFVCSVSAVIGLLCYGLSSSFNYLFGHWNVLKIVLYSLFSFIIGFLNLFANKWQHSTSHWIKAHAAFLVLTITTLYSFFFDKLMKGKPDAYSLLSCAAFAIMSLSLSRETQSGFKIDLMYFFLGSLILQLMKIKLILFIPGAGFGYLIVILRSYFSSINDAIQAESHSHSLQLASITDNDDPTSLQDENLNVIVDPHSTQLTSTDIGSSMLEQLSDYVKALQQENSTLIEMLMENLKDYLSDDSAFSGFNVSEDTDFMIMALPTETIDNIHKTAKLMVSAGFKREFSDVYSSSRRDCLVESLSRLGFKKLTIEDRRMLSWKEIENKIVRWIKASNVALKILLPTERKLCDRAFFGFSSTADLSFMGVCCESALQLLNFADVIAIGSGSPEQLHRVLKVFETMRDLIIPEFESLFRDQYSASLQKEAITVWKRLGEGIRGIFTEFTNLIQQISAEEVNLDAEIHPITIHVMNYLCAASQSRKTLEQVFEGDYGDLLKEYPKIEDRVQSSSNVSGQMGLIMELLESKLIAESKLHSRLTDLSLRFLIRNVDYIVQKAKECELGTILGDDWFKNQATQFNQEIKQKEEELLSKKLKQKQDELLLKKQKQKEEVLLSTGVKLPQMAQVFRRRG